MEYREFDQFVRHLANGASRRSVLRRAAGSAIAAPITLLSMRAAAADGKDKNKEKNKDQGNPGGQAQGAPACRDVGHPCVGVGNECCDGLQCVASGPGATLRCTAPTGGVSTTQTTQTVQTNNQVCAGNCAQTNQQAVGVQTTQTVLTQGAQFLAKAPSYWVGVDCAFDAPAYRTVCTCTGFGSEGAPRVRKITLPAADICAYVISEETKAEGERPRNVTNVAGGGEANAGTGGVANADASGGTISIGDVKGDNTAINADASGGTASADASGGNNNVAIAGGGQARNTNAAQNVDLSKLTLTLEGHVVPGRQTTYWVDTDEGRRPANGPALVQVADETPNVGEILVEARACDIPEAEPGFDWFGQCKAPGTDQKFSLLSEGGTTPLATSDTNAQGRARFGNLAPGTYQLKPEGTAWCYAESDNVDANGNIVVEADVESHIWSFTCRSLGGS